MNGFRNGREEDASFAHQPFFYLLPQGSFDHPKGGYVRRLWDDMFLSCERSAGKSLAGHLLRDGSRLEEGVQPAIRGRAWAINLGGLYCLSDSP